MTSATAWAAEPSRAAGAAVPAASAVLVVCLMGPVAERSAVVVVSRRRSAPAARPARSAPESRAPAEWAGPEGSAWPSPAECAEGGLDGGDGIARLRIGGIGPLRAIGTIGTV